jgi:hypothetical protein
MEPTDTCTLYFVMLGALIFSEVTLLLNIHRFIRVSEREMVEQSGKVVPGPNRVQVLRIAIGLALVGMIGIFGYFLTRDGCLG